MSEFINNKDKIPNVGDYIVVKKDDKFWVCIFIKIEESKPLCMPFSRTDRDYVSLWSFDEWMPVNFIL